MTNTGILFESVTNAKQIARGKVLAIRDDELVVVACRCDKPIKVFCDVLQTSDRLGPPMAVDDTVLVWLPENDQEKGIVLGRIGPSRAPAPDQEKTKETPEELVIEAKKNLTFKCGEGSITLRKDGKILIKGKDLVSRAKRMNRIKGGAVAIN